MKTCKLRDAVLKAQRALLSSEVVPETSSQYETARIGDLRLRAFDVFSEKGGQTYGGQEDSTLEEIGLAKDSNAVTMLLEVKTPEVTTRLDSDLKIVIV